MQPDPTARPGVPACSPQHPGTSGRPAFSIREPADVLAFIPHSLGFAPQESLVLLTMDANRLGATLRLDLPSSSADYSGYAASVTRLLSSDARADGVLMALYTEAPWQRPDKPPYRRLVARLGKALGDAGMPVREGWLVSSLTWREYFCADVACCPWPGHPRGEISDSALSAELVYRGSAFAPTLAAAVDSSLPVSWPEPERTAAHREVFARRVKDRWCNGRQFAATLACWDRFVADAAAGRPGHGYPALRNEPEAAGFLLASLRDRTVRDALLVQAALGNRHALAGAADCGMLTSGATEGTVDRAGDLLPPVPPSTAPLRRQPAVRAPLLPASPADGDFDAAGLSVWAEVAALSALERRDLSEDFRAVLTGQLGAAPDWNRMDAACGVFTELLAVAGGEDAAALLSLLAWIEWARGRGSRAQVFLDRCLADSPGYRLAELLRDLLGTGVLPVWARTGATAWKGESERIAGSVRP